MSGAIVCSDLGSQIVTSGWHGLRDGFDGMIRQSAQAAVEQVLDSKLPESYDRVLFREKCDNVFYLMLDYASHHRKWAA